jgi:hypothetical protein
LRKIRDYTGRLIKLIPAEIVGLYLTVRGFWKDSSLPASQEYGFLVWWPLACALVLCMTRAWGTRKPDGSWQTVQLTPIFIAVISLFIWIYSIGDAAFGWQPNPKLVSTALVMWVFLVPYFYKGEAQ